MTTIPRPWPSPTWLDGVADETERESERLRVLLGLACIYHSRRGKLADLAESLGITANALAIAKARGQVSPEMAIALEKALGRDLFPREAFRPDIFVIES